MWWEQIPVQIWDALKWILIFGALYGLSMLTIEFFLGDKEKKKNKKKRVI